jgi:hypothetical protein
MYAGSRLVLPNQTSVHVCCCLGECREFTPVLNTAGMHAYTHTQQSFSKLEEMNISSKLARHFAVLCMRNNEGSNSGPAMHILYATEKQRVGNTFKLFL